MSWISELVNVGANLAAIVGPKTVASLIGLDSNSLESIINALGQPTLCYIPILSEKLTVRRTADIGTTMLISQTDQTKEYITDNAAPRPRTWSGTGFISSLVPMIENGLWLKPSLLVQQTVLETAADSRQPVKFKTDTGEVVDVLIADLQISSTPKGSGVKEITYTVQEVKILENAITAGNVVSKLLDKIASKSIPLRSILNLGGNTALYSGIAVSALALLKKPAELEAYIQEEAQAVVFIATDLSQEIEESPAKPIDTSEIQKEVETLTLNLTGQDLSGTYLYSTYRIVNTEITEDDDECQQTVTVGDYTFLLVLSWIEVEQAVLDGDGNVVTPAKYAWSLSIDSVAASASQRIAQRSLTLYPNTIHYDGDDIYTVAIISSLESIGHGDLQNVYITIGVKN